MSDGDAEAHARMYSRYVQHRLLTKSMLPYFLLNITTGIYRCSMLDMSWKSLRDISVRQESARINAFYVTNSETTLRFRYIPLRFTPDRGFCEAVCDRKVINKNLYLQKIFSERWYCTFVANRTFVIFGGITSGEGRGSGGCAARGGSAARS